MSSREHSAQMLVDRVVSDPQLLARVQANPASELRAVADEIVRGIPPALQTDPWIYRVVVTALGSAVLLALGGATWLSGNGKNEVPDILTAIGSAAVGALAGLLAPVPIATPESRAGTPR